MHEAHDIARVYRGRVSDLTLERYVLGELSEVEREEVRAHLASSPEDEARRQAIVDDEAMRQCDERDAMHGGHANIVPFTDARDRAPAGASGASSVPRHVWFLAAALLLCVATAGVMMKSTSSESGVDEHGATETDTWRAKGGAFEIGFYSDRREGGLRLQQGDSVSPGERVGFVVTTHRRGYLLVVGVDSTGETYLAYPQSGERYGMPRGVEAQTPLNAAIRFTERGSSELLFAIYCRRPVSLDGVSASIKAIWRDDGDAPRWRSDCQTSTIRLHKSPGGQP